MYRILQSLYRRPFVQQTITWVSVIVRVIRQGWRWLTKPLRVWVYPLFDPLLQPLRERWARFKARHPRWGWGLGWLGTMVRWGFNFVVFIILGVWVGLFGRLPGKEELKNIETAQSTEIYSADSVLIGKYFIENRTTISLKKISPHVINALIATEDRRFLEHSGIDYLSWFRVFKGISTGQTGLGGGSTLSQQLAKNLYPRKNYWIPGVSLFINKVRENFISVRLEKIYSKDDLLAMYLNTVPFGGDRFGISVASRYFFGKKAADLNPAEAATLVGMLKATTALDPIRNPNDSQKRRNLVLRQMVRNGHLTQQEYEMYAEKPIGARRHTREGYTDGSGTYFREHLRTEVLPALLKDVKKEDGSAYNLYTDGLKIYTTLHARMQEYAEQSVAKHMADVQKNFNQQFKHLKKEKPWGNDTLLFEQVRRSARWQALKENGADDSTAYRHFLLPVSMTVFTWAKGGSEKDTIMTPLDSVKYYFTMMNCGFMVMDHRNGYVRAWVGGINFKYFKYDHVKSRRQVGSTFKPIVYAGALLDSMKPCDYFPNQRITIGDWSPDNTDGKYGGYYSMAGALKNSVNVVAALLIQKIGIQKTIQLARKMGITSPLPREFGISLGAADISLYEMMQVYGTIANGGRRPDPVLVTKIVDREGRVLYEKVKNTVATALSRQDTAMSEYHAAALRRMMQGVLDSGGTGARFRRMYYLQGDFAGKTGTTQRQSDGWFICFNPQLVTGAWVGGPSPAVRFRSMYLGQGSASALPICALFWHKMASDKQFSRLLLEKFKEPKVSIEPLFYCGTRVWTHPDSILTDSLATDTLHTSMLQRLKENIAELLGKDKQDNHPTREEAPPTEASTTERALRREERREERRERRREFFDNLFGRKNKNQKDNLDNEDDEQ